MYVMVEPRAEAVQEGAGAEPRAGGCEEVGVNRHACRSVQQPLDLNKKDLCERREGPGSVGEKAP
jgi:hypothetical protein